MKSYLNLKYIWQSMLLFFTALLFTSTACDPAAPKEVKTYPVIVELIDREGIYTDSTFLETGKTFGVKETDIYAWTNHRLIYGFTGDPEGLGSSLPGMEVKVYENPYYIFDRSSCETGQVDGAWEHKILTANLVSDPLLQHEYMDYHAHQSERFPEVSTGFCRAEFQQVVMYRNGRQLMLVISIPAGKDYDTLNARTVHNNPRVDEWNSIMGKFQEGIDGTQPDETWVFFEPLF